MQDLKINELQFIFGGWGYISVDIIPVVSPVYIYDPLPVVVYDPYPAYYDPYPVYYDVVTTYGCYNCGYGYSYGYDVIIF